MRLSVEMFSHEFRMFRHKESDDDVYKALVQQLFENTSSTWIMGVLIFGVGVYAYALTHSTAILVSATCGALASVLKVGMMLYHRPRMDQPSMTLAEVSRLEILQGLTIFTVAVSVGALAAAIFLQADLALQMLAVALMFGYSAGVATRLCVRPTIAALALCFAGIPALVVTSMGDATHIVLAIVFAMFMVAGFQGIWFTYQGTRQQIAQRLEMASFARRDALTGLPNRRALRETFAALSQAPAGLKAVHCFDLDGFKAVNDRLGHLSGDVLLETLAARLKPLIVAPAMVARIGGDEFVVVQPGIRDAAGAATLAERIVDSLTEPYDLSGTSVTIGVSLGYAVAADSSVSLDDLMRAADSACYRAKRRGGGIEAEIPLPVGRQSFFAAA